MGTIPDIKVQFIHIQGPLKGEIQEFTDPEITIGRHPDCQVKFPKDLVELSRVHATIVREGNRFKIIDRSTNGTYVNGLRIVENYLKDGDVLMFSEGGPKASFLTQTIDQPAGHPPQEHASEPQPYMPPQIPSNASGPEQQQPQQSSAPPKVQQPVAAPIVEKAKAPFAIQYGPALKSFQTLPITIGSGPGCDFSITHSALKEQHVQIYFSQNQYWVKDLTGIGAVMINGQSIPGQSKLEPDMQLALSDNGPKFKFISGGRLAELEDPLPDSPPQPRTENIDQEPAASKENRPGKKPGTLFKKFFS